jgi:hypothetical protein
MPAVLQEPTFHLCDGLCDAGTLSSSSGIAGTEVNELGRHYTPIS